MDSYADSGFVYFEDIANDRLKSATSKKPQRNKYLKHCWECMGPPGPLNVRLMYCCEMKDSPMANPICSYPPVIVSQHHGASPKLFPCSYFSCKLCTTKRNYDIRDQKLLAMKVAFEEWCDWLEWAKHPFLVLTDHRNLQYLCTDKRLNRQTLSTGLTHFQCVLGFQPPLFPWSEKPMDLLPINIWLQRSETTWTQVFFFFFCFFFIIFPNSGKVWVIRYSQLNINIRGIDSI